MALNRFKELVSPVINYLGKKKEAHVFCGEPILIGGCGRSGTTLLLSIIGAHPKVFAFDKETTTFANWKKEREKYLPCRLDRLYRKILFSRISPRVTRWCEKTPRNVLYFDRILDYFQGQVKLIHIIRDGRDVMLSKHPTEPDKYWIDPDRWVRDVKAGLEYRDHPQVLTIKYEDLVLSYEDTVEEICSFLGEECTAEIYDWIENTDVKKNKAWGGEARKLHAKSIGKWKKEENKERVEEVMQREEVRELLIELGYIESNS